MIINKEIEQLNNNIKENEILRKEQINDLLDLVNNTIKEKDTKRITLRYNLILHNLIIIDSLILTYKTHLERL
jgi:hypothetical protein